MCKNENHNDDYSKAYTDHSENLKQGIKGCMNLHAVVDHNYVCYIYYDMHID